MAAFLPLGKGHALDGLVHRFGAPGGEDDILGVGVKQSRGLVPGLIQGLGRGLTEAMIAGWIAEDIIHDMVHRLFYLGMEGRGGVIVKIYHIHAEFLRQSVYLVFMGQIGAAGLAERRFPLVFHVTIGAVAGVDFFRGMRHPFSFDAEGLIGLPVPVVFDGRVQGIGTQVGAVQFVRG